MADRPTAQQLRRIAAIRSRWLPRGPLDLVLQLAVIALAYTAWRYARGAVHGDTVAELGPALANARELIDWERSLGLLFEPSLQSSALEWSWPAEIARWGYANLHFKLTCLALLTVYFWRPGSYPFVRNVVIAAMAISLLGYALYPTAPPRFVPELGLDGSAAVTGNEPLRLSGTDALYNPFAAVPSMHIGLALILAGSLAMLARRPWLRAVLLAYPLLMTYIVVASGNHFWLDAVYGAICAALALGVAIGLARLRRAWSFHPASPHRRSGAIEPAPEPKAATV